MYLKFWTFRWTKCKKIVYYDPRPGSLSSLENALLAEEVGISEEKLNDLKRLLRYLSPEAQDFHENLFKDTAVKLKKNK